MIGKTYVVITTRFEAIHNWPGCPFEDVEFLRFHHRHIFHVVMKWEVKHNDRDIEFIRQKREVEEFINKHWAEKDLGSKSCEMLAKNLAYSFNADFVSVYEDGENGAEFVRT